MLRLSRVALVAVSLVLVTPALAPAQESPRLEGAWVLEEVRAGDRVISDPAPAMYLVTDHHIAFVDAQSESALDFEHPGEPTQAEKAVAYDAFATVRVEADTAWFDLADRPLIVKFRRVDGDPLPR